MNARLPWVFFKRDALIAMSYRTSFAVQLLGNVLLLGIFYYIGKLIDASANPAMEPYGGSYLAFMLIGLALTDCVGVSLTTFAKQVREGQLTGTLEATLMSPVRLPVILIYSSLWAYFFSAFRFVFYLLVGGILYSVSLRQANLTSALVIFVLTILCFAGVGILWASVVILIKRGEAVLNTVGIVAILVSGVLFPVQLLPSWVEKGATLIPLTHALEGMRRAILNGAGLIALSQTVLTLSLFAVVLLGIGIGSFNRAVALVKSTGSLVEY